PKRGACGGSYTSAGLPAMSSVVQVPFMERPLTAGVGRGVIVGPGARVVTDRRAQVSGPGFSDSDWRFRPGAFNLMEAGFSPRTLELGRAQYSISPADAVRALLEEASWK